MAMPDFPTVLQLITDLVNPVLGVIGVFLRGLGALGLGVVAGRVLRNGIDFKFQARFFVPLIFLGVAIIVAAVTFGTWSSPGTIGLMGLGLLVGYQFMRTRPQAEESQVED
jgi:hypothetical protein